MLINNNEEKLFLQVIQKQNSKVVLAGLHFLSLILFFLLISRNINLINVMSHFPKWTLCIKAL